MIDWDERDFVLPPQYSLAPFTYSSSCFTDTMNQPAANQPFGVHTGPSIFHHTTSGMARAIGSVSKFSSIDRGDACTVLYVNAFDRLFTYYEQMKHYVGIGVIRAEDIRSLGYYLVKVTNKTVNGDTIPLFDPYLTRFGYTEV